MKPSSNQLPYQNTSEQDGLPLARDLGSAVDGLDKNAAQAVCLIASDGRILEANAACCTIFKIKGKAQGKNILEYTAPSERGLMGRKFLLAQHHQKNYVIELKPKGANPSVVVKMHLEVQKNALCLTEIVDFPFKEEKRPVLVQDLSVTNLPDTQTAETNFAFVADCIPMPVLLYNKEHRLQYGNDCFLNFAGYASIEEILALGEEALLSEEFSILAPMRNRVVQGTINNESRQLQINTKAGTKRWVTFTFSKVPHQDLYMALLQDIDQLKDQEAALQQKQEDMGVFMDWAFHDLKGPLNSLMALYNLVENEYGENARVMEYFQHYHQGITRLHRTLHDLLMLSRIQKAEPSFKPLCLKQMVEECLQSFRNLPSFYKIRFIKKIEIENVLISEENLLRTIVQNLLENAIKYSAERDPLVCIEATEKDNGFLLEVSDNGIGIPEELQQKVFDRFFRATTKGSGSGLGLYLLRQAVHKLKGKVSLHSAEGEGTTLTVFIPFHQG